MGGARENTSTTEREGVMQTQIFRRAVLGLMALGLTLSMLAIFGCGGGDDNEVQRQASLTGAAERPDPRTTPGTGTAVFIIENEEIRYELTYTGLKNVVQAHIHEGSDAVAGPIFLFLCANGALRGYPETLSPCYSDIKQHSCGNETQDDHKD